jgi:hypothetical protein
MFSERPTLAFVTALALATLTIAGCPGTLDLGPFLDAAAASDGGSDGASTSCPDVPTQILAPQCAKAGCHVGVNAPGNLDLSAAGLPSLPGKSDPTCGGLFVDPAQPEKSVLYEKLGANLPCGGRMPSGAPPLSDSDQQCVLAWIRTLPNAAPAEAGAD